LLVDSNLTCRLPVNTETGNDVVRGWITFPAATFSQDLTVLRNPSGNNMPSYDWAIRAWVPVEQNYLAPDGTKFVVQHITPVAHEIYLVDTKTGKQQLLTTAGPGPGRHWTGYFHYATEGIYAWAYRDGSDVPVTIPGLWLLDPKTARIRLIDGGHFWDSIGGGYAWAAEDPATVGGTLFKVYRLDLATGQSALWYQ